MLSKNQQLTLECTALGASFEGVCRHDGQVVFVPGALPGEALRARIIKVTRQYAVGRLEALLSTSEIRQEPPCPNFPRCGGCTAQHIRYEETLRHKHRQVADCLQRIGKLGPVPVAPTLGMPWPWRYRNKGAFPVGGEPGSPAIGLYAARSHSIIDTPQGCLLQSEACDAAVRAVRRWMQAYRIQPYCEATHSGLVRHIVTREAADGSLMVVLVAGEDSLPHSQALLDGLREAVPSIRSVQLSVNDQRTNVILGERVRTLWGEDTLVDEIADFSFYVSAQTFFQVNRPQAQALYAKALEFAALRGDEVCWDLYCGCGTITLPLARESREAVGIEIVEAAVRDAQRNAAHNNVSNARFLSGAAEVLLPTLAQREGRPDVVMLDPPRKGCEPAVLQALLQAAPQRIVYVSCNPATLARDLAVLCGGGYSLGAVQPVDMFGWTAHVECVAVLNKKNEGEMHHA